MKSKSTCLVIFLSVIMFGFKADTKTPKLNVLFIIADDLNCDLGSYGHPTVKTPNIDQLARNGVLFGNAHNQFPLCGPSRASFMTGMYADQTKLKHNRVYLRQTVPKVTTLGQKFRMEAYHSIRIGKIYHYDNPASIGTSSFDDVYTWDQTINPYGRDKIEEYKINTLKPNSYGGTLSWLAAEGTDEEQTDGIAATEANELLDKFSKNGENFFLAVGLYRPHTPYVAPKKYFDMYPLEEISVPKSSADYLRTLPPAAAKSIRAKKEQIDLDEKTAKTVIQAYYATTSFVDAQVGRILDKLKETGLDKNTVIVFTSDHGYHMGEHGHWQKQTLFDNATRIPLVFSGPGIKKDIKIHKAPVEMIDIYPTLMNLLGMETPSFVSGKSLHPMLNGSSKSVRNSALTEWYGGYSIKTDRYRLTQWGEKGTGGYELYDHNSDKEELNNLAQKPKHQKIKDSLILVINQRIAEARKIPEGLGPQIEGVRSMNKPKAIHATKK